MSRAIWKDLDSYIDRKRSQKKRKVKDRIVRFKRKAHKKVRELKDKVNLRRIGIRKRDIELLNQNIKDTLIIHREKNVFSKLHKKIKKHLKNRKEDKLQRETASKIEQIKETVEKKEAEREKEEDREYSDDRDNENASEKLKENSKKTDESVDD